MVGWHHRLNGHEFEQIPGDGEGQHRLACRSPRDRKESDTTERLDNNNKGGSGGYILVDSESLGEHQPVPRSWSFGRILG